MKQVLVQPQQFFGEGISCQLDSIAGLRALRAVDQAAPPDPFQKETNQKTAYEKINLSIFCWNIFLLTSLLIIYFFPVTNKKSERNNNLLNLLKGKFLVVCVWDWYDN